MLGGWRHGSILEQIRIEQVNGSAIISRANPALSRRQLQNTIAWRCSSTTSPIAKAFPDQKHSSARALLRRIAEAACAGVDWIQLREKDLSPRELERLAGEAVSAVRDHSATTKLLINGRTDVALACGADGVHLPAGELAASEVRALWMQCRASRPLIGVSAHTTADVHDAKSKRSGLRCFRADLREGANRNAGNRPGGFARGLCGSRRSLRCARVRRSYALERSCLYRGWGRWCGRYPPVSTRRLVRDGAAASRTIRSQRSALLRLHINGIIGRRRFVILAVLVLVRG